MAGFVGRTLGRYNVLLEIAQGGMATVYRGYDPEREQAVAIKVLSPFLSNQPKFRARFEREAELMHSLRHPNIVPLLDYGQARHSIYLVMPFMNIGSLADRLHQGSISVTAGARIIDQMAAALEHAHAFGVVHRDVKPSNILIDEKFHAWLSDFGFAYVYDGSVNLTGSTLIGTPAYMAPEQILGHKVTPKADQYALGVVLYQLCTGRLPYDAATPMKLALKHATEPLPRPRLVNPNLPDAVEEVLLRSLSKDPNFRFDSVRDFNIAFHESLKKVIDPETGGLRAGVLSQLPRAELAPFAPTLVGASLQMLPGQPRPKTAARLPVKWFAWLLGAAPVALLGVVLGVRAILGWMNQPSVSPLPETHNLHDEVVDPVQPDPVKGDPLETAVVATFMSLQETEGVVWETATPENQQVISLETSSVEQAVLALIPNPTPTGFPPTARPTITALPTSTEPPPRCASYALSDFMLNRDQVSWQLEVSGGDPTVMTALQLSWPDENGTLFKVSLGDATIWVGEMGSPAALQTWTGGETSRVVEHSEGIAFRFREGAQAQGYSVVVTLANGCRISGGN